MAMDLYDPVFRVTGDPRWDQRTVADLPSRRRLRHLRAEHRAWLHAHAPMRPSWSRRSAMRLGDLLVTLGERLRANAGTSQSLSR